MNIAIHRDDTLKLIKDLISINSVNPSLSPGGKGEREIALYICEYMKELGMKTFIQEIRPGRANAVGVLKGSGGGRALMLNGHADTVGVEGMEHNPFSPYLESGRIYGRGAYDMKAGLAAQLAAIQGVISSGALLRGDVIMAAVADEEYSSLGTEHLINSFSADAAILAEPTDLNIVTAHKGFAWTRIEVFGKAAHGSLPEKGVDAIVKMGNVLAQLEYLEREILPSRQHPLLGRPSIHASRIIGGKEISTYPDYCELELERRTLPNETREEAEQEIRDMLARMGEKDDSGGIRWELFFFRPGLEIDRDSCIVQTLDRSFREITGRAPAYTGLSCWMDSALLAAAGIPAVIFGPSGDGAHAAVEYADTESIFSAAAILARTISGFCA